eukprot:1870164-Rhodomonas_salina.4
MKEHPEETAAEPRSAKHWDFVGLDGKSFDVSDRACLPCAVPCFRRRMRCGRSPTEVASHACVRHLGVLGLCWAVVHLAGRHPCSTELVCPQMRGPVSTV